MAQSRLEKIGTIYTRVSGLLKSGAMRSEDKPIWYEVFAAFPPKLEPRFDRPEPNIPIRSIFYTEDVVRAKYHKSLKQQEVVNLADTKRDTQSQRFINIYNSLKEQGALDQEQVFATAQDLLAEQRQQARLEYVDSSSAAEEPAEESNLLQNYTQAEVKQKSSSSPSAPRATTKSAIDIQNLFKE